MCEYIYICADGGDEEEAYIEWANSTMLFHSSKISSPSYSSIPIFYLLTLAS